MSYLSQSTGIGSTFIDNEDPLQQKSPDNPKLNDLLTRTSIIAIDNISIKAAEKHKNGALMATFFFFGSAVGVIGCEAVKEAVSKVYPTTIIPVSVIFALCSTVISIPLAMYATGVCDDCKKENIEI